MLEVGEEPDNVTKTGADSGIPALREAALRIPREVDTRGRRSGPRAAALWSEGRRSGSRRVGRLREDLGAAVWTACRPATS